jgi:hypothetical protein
MANVNISPVAANEDSFEPVEFKDSAFNGWALRTALRLVNLPPGSAEDRMQRVFVAEGMPSSAWIAALVLMMELVRSKRNGGAA